MNGGLNFSDFGSSYNSKKQESTFRKAGEVFTSGDNNTINNSSVSNNSGNSSNYDRWMSYMNNQSSSQSSSSNSQSQSKPINGWTPKEQTTATPKQNESIEQTTEVAKGTTDKMGRPTQVSTMTEGQKLAQNVRPEYAKQAADFYDKTAAKYGDNPELMGNILTYMGGDMFLPDPDKVKASWEKKYANRPELLANINMYMGGGAGKVGHNR